MDRLFNFIARSKLMLFIARARRADLVEQTLRRQKIRVLAGCLQVAPDFVPLQSDFAVIFLSINHRPDSSLSQPSNVPHANSFVA